MSEVSSSTAACQRNGIWWPTTPQVVTRKVRYSVNYLLFPDQSMGVPLFHEINM